MPYFFANINVKHRKEHIQNFKNILALNDYPSYFYLKNQEIYQCAHVR